MMMLWLRQNQAVAQQAHRHRPSRAKDRDLNQRARRRLAHLRHVDPTLRERQPAPIEVRRAVSRPADQDGTSRTAQAPATKHKALDRVDESLRDEMLVLLPNLRAFAIS